MFLITEAPNNSKLQFQIVKEFVDTKFTTEEEVLQYVRDNVEVSDIDAVTFDLKIKKASLDVARKTRRGTGNRIVESSDDVIVFYESTRIEFDRPFRFEDGKYILNPKWKDYFVIFKK